MVDHHHKPYGSRSDDDAETAHSFAGHVDVFDESGGDSFEFRVRHGFRRDFADCHAVPLHTCLTVLIGNNADIQGGVACQDFLNRLPEAFRVIVGGEAETIGYVVGQVVTVSGAEIYSQLALAQRGMYHINGVFGIL